MKPFKFLPNRVLRLYTGGSGIDRLRGAGHPRDSRTPEDWIASCVEAGRRTACPPGHGISHVEYDGKIVRFPDLLHEHAPEILGPSHLERHGEDPALLTKLLDSAEQLPLQVHPTREDAKRIFHLPYGKTEAWIVLATRKVNNEDPYLIAGFNEKLDRGAFIGESIAGEYREGLKMLHRIPVRPGDAVMIRGGLPHAIGPGVTMVEVMEPSDLVIVPEIDCCGVKLDEKKRFAGLAPEQAMTLFDYTKQTRDELLRSVRIEPEILAETGSGIFQRLIPLNRANGCFEAYRVKLDGSFTPEFPRRTFRVGIVVSGNVRCGSLPLRAGDGFFIPYDADSAELTGKGELLFTLPPR